VVENHDNPEGSFVQASRALSALLSKPTTTSNSPYLPAQGCSQTTLWRDVSAVRRNLLLCHLQPGLAMLFGPFLGLETMVKAPRACTLLSLCEAVPMKSAGHF
jgi:hypothetical protein